MNTKEKTNKMNKQTSSKREDLVFKVSESRNYDKGTWWFILAFLAFALIIISTMELHQIFLGVIVVLGMIVFYQLALLESKPTKFILGEKGVTFRDKFYTWETFHSFSVFGKGKHLAIHFEALSPFINPIVIPLSEEMGYLDKGEDINDRELALNILRRFVPEKLRASHTLNDWLSHLFKF